MTNAESSASDAVIPTRSVDPSGGVTGVLRIAPFRRLWSAVAATSLADWLGLLALTSAAMWAVDGDYRDHAVVISAVFVLRLLPAAVLAPVTAFLADHLDRRWTMILCDVVRFGLLVSVPIVGEVWWLLAVTALGGIAGALWAPARDATVPNLVPRQRLATATQFNLVTTYAAAPVAAALFVGLSLLTRLLAPHVEAFAEQPSELALYTAAGIHLLAAMFVYALRLPTRGRSLSTRRTGILGVLKDGRAVWRRGRTARGLLLGMVALFLGAGALVGVAPLLAADLGAGNAAYGTIFLALLAGVAGGLLWGPRVVPAFSRRRLFGLMVVLAGLTLVVLAAVANIVVVVVLAALAGAFSGIAWVTGYTMFGLDLGDELRARAFAFAQALVRLALFAALAAAAPLAGAYGVHSWTAGEFTFDYNGAALLLASAGGLVLLLGLVTLLTVDDRRGTPLLRDLVDSARNEDHVTGRPAGATGYFIALEGGEGAGKSTQVEAIAAWIRAKGHEVVVTREPGATEIGRRLRAMLLDVGSTGLDPRTEALLYAADRAEHVATVLRPALERGAIVISDRYIDSSIAYQGAGRGLGAREIGRVSRWAADGLRPDLTILLDVDPAVGHGRFTEAPDRLESEPLEFHRTVRNAFLDLAALDPDHYLVVDAAQEPDHVTTAIRHRLDRELPLSEQEQRQAEELAARMREEDARRKAELARQEAEKQALIARLRAESEERERIAEEERLAEEARRQAEEARRAAEEERRRAEEEARRAADAARERAEEARHRAERERERLEEEARVRAEQQARIAEEVERRARETAEREAEEERARAERRRQAEAETAAAEERAKARAEREKAETAEREKAEADERRRAAEEERERAEAERERRDAEAAAEADRRAKERRKAEEALRLAEADRRAAEEEASRAAVAAATAQARAAQEAAALAAEADGVTDDEEEADTRELPVVRPASAVVRDEPEGDVDETREIPRVDLEALRRRRADADETQTLADDLLGPWGAGDDEDEDEDEDGDEDEAPTAPAPATRRRWLRK